MILHAWYPGSGVLAPAVFDGPWGSVGCQPAAGSAVRRLALFLIVVGVGRRSANRLFLLRGVR
jgi:hypothetical protein